MSEFCTRCEFFGLRKCLLVVVGKGVLGRGTWWLRKGGSRKKTVGSGAQARPVERRAGLLEASALPSSEVVYLAAVSDDDDADLNEGNGLCLNSVAPNRFHVARVE